MYVENVFFIETGTNTGEYFQVLLGSEEECPIDGCPSADDVAPQYAEVVFLRPEATQGCKTFSIGEVDDDMGRRITGRVALIKAFPNIAVEANDPSGQQRFFGSNDDDFLLCPDTTAGTYDFIFTALDGVGGKAIFPLTVHILEERSLEGAVFWGGGLDDYDNDGIPNGADTEPFNASSALADDDGDGVDNESDAFPQDASETLDSDGDGVGDNADTDDDNDQTLDVYDHFPLDSQNQYVPLADAIAGIVDPTLRVCVENLATGMTSVAEFTDLGQSEPGPCGEGVTSLEGLELFTHLTHITVLSGIVSDLTPLSGLTDLEWIELQDQRITSIDPITGLSKIQSLGLNYNPIETLPAGAYLTNLRELHLSYSSISDHSALAGASSIEVLNLQQQPSFDPSVITDLTTLRLFALGENGISDLTPFAGLTNAYQLGLGGNQIGDLSPLVQMAARTDFGNIYLENNQISDVSVLGTFASGSFFLAGNPISCNSLAAAQANPSITIYYTDACATAVSVGSETDVIGSAPSNHFDVDAASDGRSVVAWQTGQPGGGASKVLVQRFDAAGNTDGGIVEVQDSPYGSGPVRVEWLSNDSVAVTFTSYESGRYRTELRIVDQNNGLIHSSQVIGDSSRDYKPQDMVDMGDGRLIISWNMTPNHPQLPNLGAAAQLYDYAGSSLGLPFWIAESATGSTSSGWSISTFSAVKVDDDRVAFAVDDRSNGVDREYSVVTFNVTADLDVDSDSDGYADKSPDYQQSFYTTNREADGISFALLELDSLRTEDLVSLGYGVIQFDPTNQTIVGSLIGADGEFLVEKKTLVSNASEFGRPSVINIDASIRSIDLAWKKSDQTGVFYRRFDANLDPVYSADTQVFGSGSGTYLLPLSKDRLRLFRSVSFDNAITFSDILDSSSSSLDAFDCGNSFCVLNDAQVTDNDRTYFYSLSEAFSGFEFDQTTYQLSNQAERAGRLSNST